MGRACGCGGSISHGENRQLRPAAAWLPGEEDRIILEIGSQEDAEFQIDFGRRHGPFDIVIDDGGHYAHQHLASYKALWQFVKPDGWYAIEDCQTLFCPPWTHPAEPTNPTDR